MKGFHDFRALIRARLDDEIGTHPPRGAARVSRSSIPSPYHVGMSSLGFQTIYRAAQRASPGWAAERAFLPDDVAAWRRRARCRSSPTRARRRSASFPVIAFSVAYELELAGLFDCLELAGLPLLADERDARASAGRRRRAAHLLEPAAARRRSSTWWCSARPRSWSPSCSPPSPPSPIARALLDAARARARLLGAVAARRAAAGRSRAPTTRSCRRARRSSRRTPSCARMFLIEPERGCSRGCTYCVMRRSTNGGMRLVAPDVVLGADPRATRGAWAWWARR